MTIFWSLHNGNSLGKAYWKSRTASIFLPNLVEQTKNNDYPFPAFLTYLYAAILHEHMHLFLKYRLKKYAYSCKTIIEPCVWKMVSALLEIDGWFNQIVIDFQDVESFLEERK